MKVSLDFLGNNPTAMPNLLKTPRATWVPTQRMIIRLAGILSQGLSLMVLKLGAIKHFSFQV